ncbi:MAG TPA: hypothetical protein VK179_01765 [Bacteroidales bacterium]|nr:hypothetical protein [Bacteroidales bacterium]
MKISRSFLFLLFIAISATVAAMSPPPGGHHGGTVNTPLDGGLLSILGIAGIVYYLFRKRNSKKE